MSPPGMGLLHIPRITSKSTLSLAILFSTSPDAVKLLQQTPSSLTLLLLMMVPPWPNSSVAVILLSVMHMASNQPNNSSTLSLTTSENGEPWISSSVMEANMKSLSESLISSVPYSSKIISLNPIINTKTRLKIVLDLQALHQHCHEHLWLPCFLLAPLFAVHLCCTQPLAISYSSGHLPYSSFARNYSRCQFHAPLLIYEPVYYRIDSSEPDLNFPSSSNEKKGYWVGFADNRGDSLTWRILTEDPHKIIIRSGVRSALRTTTNQRLASPSGEGTHFLFPFLILNNLQILCHLTLLMHQLPILSNLSKVSLVKMKIIQSPWPTLTFPIFLADPSIYHLRIMGSATWPKSLTLMTMDNLLKTLNSSSRSTKIKLRKSCPTTNLWTTSRREQMLKKLQTHSSSLETLLHTKAHLSQLTLTTRGANTMLWLSGSLGRSLMSP